MKLARLWRLRGLMSTGKRVAAEERIGELFGEARVVERGAEVRRQLAARRVEQQAQAARSRNYHHYEYYRGEDLIENIPYYDHLRYTLRDKNAEDADRQRKAIEMLTPVGNHQARARLIREKLAAYHDKQRKFELEEFERYLSEYPGTVRGPRPEDDWEAYRAYGLKKIPKILADQINEERELQKGRRIGLASAASGEQRPHIESPLSIFNYFSKDRDLLPEDEKEGDPEVQTEVKNDENMELMRKDYEEPMLEDFKTEVPLMPNYNFESYQHFVNHWINWLNFRNSYVQFNLAANLQKLDQRMQRLTDSLDEHPEHQFMEVHANIPSLCRYYRCLPKELQDHPGLKDIYLGLEYSAPDFTYEEKEEALNYVCRFLLPFDDISNKVIGEFTSKSRVYPTPFLFDKLFTISPEYTWDLRNFLEEIRRQELKGETSNQNKELRFPEPPEVHKMWEEGAANLPVDFYDNEDGFWDEVISEKLRRYDQFKPMLKTRKYFTH